MKWGVWAVCLALAGGVQAQEGPLPVGPWTAEVARWVEPVDAEAARWLRKDFAEELAVAPWTPGRLDTLQRTLEVLREDRTFKPASGVHYLKTAAFLAAAPGSTGWSAWHAVVANLAGKKAWRKALPDFLAISQPFFQQGVLSDRPQAVWRLEGASPDFRTDSIPVLRIQGATLVGECTGDRVELRDVWGEWRIADGEVRMDSAFMPWQGTELDPLTHHARLRSTVLRLDAEGFDAPRAVMVSNWFEQGLEGEVRVRLVRNRNPEDVGFPRFDSANRSVVLDSIQPGMRFQGGLGIRGGTLMGIGVEGEPARIDVFQKDTLLFRAGAREILFDLKGFSALHTEMTIFWENDSIYHPDVRMRYAVANRRLTFLRERDGLGMRPFVDTYHDVVFDADAVSWVLEAPSVEIGSLESTTDRRASFRSSDFFRIQSFEAMKGIDPVHPLVELMQFVRATGAMEFSAAPYGRQIGLSETQAQMIFIRLALEGYVDLDLDTWRCTVLPKATETLDHVRGKLDYDVLAFESDVKSGPNAEFSLLNGRLNLKGVDLVQASDSQSVRIFPKDGRLSLGRNRSFTFEGIVRAGNLEFSGQGFTFDYEQFRITLNRVDALHLMVTDPERLDARGLPVRSRVKNALSEVSGTLAIDHPLNRSGTRSAMYPNYPSFESDTTSFVYFDESAIRSDVYDRDRFYYAVEPFSLRHIDRLEPQDLQFAGNLVSGGIFADHSEPLVLMEDLSLGMAWTTPAEGEPVYGGEARWYSRIKLDLGGLQGTGTFAFLSGKVEGEGQIFLPDSLRASNVRCTNALDRKLHVASVSGEQASAVFRAGSKELQLLSGKEGFRCILDSVRFDGDVRLSRSGLLGTGELAYKDGRIRMDKGSLQEERVRASQAEFWLISPRTRNEVLRAPEVIADVDFTGRVGRFTYRDGERSVEFPEHKYRAFLDRLDWNMERAVVQVATDRTFPSGDVWTDPARKERANFVSTASPDTLRFFAPVATFDVVENRIACTRVPELLVADARLVPRGGDLGIRENARHEPLIGAELLLPVTDPVHKIVDATLEVQDGMRYSGSGDYVFHDGSGTGRVVPLDKLGVDSEGTSYGSGKVSEKDLVFFGPAFQFKGDVNLLATERFLGFDGGVQLAAGCLSYDRSWLKFADRIDPSAPAFQVSDRPTDLRGKPLVFSWTASVGEPYGIAERFMSEIDTTEDRPLFRPTGWLQHRNGIYTVGDTASLVPGATLAVEGCKVTNRGEIRLPFEAPGIGVRMYGTGGGDGASSMQLTGVLAIDMPVDAKVWSFPARALPMFQTAADPDATSGMSDAVAAWSDPKDREEAVAEWDLAGRFRRIPKGLEATWMLTGVQLVWDAREDLWMSKGRIGVAWLGEEQVHRTVPGKLELARGRAGDGLRFYLHGDDSNWYFFDYRLNALGMSASDAPFLEAIGAIKEEKRSTELEGGRSFRYFPILQRKRRDDFVDAYREFE